MEEKANRQCQTVAVPTAQSKCEKNARLYYGSIEECNTGGNFDFLLELVIQKQRKLFPKRKELKKKKKN